MVNLRNGDRLRGEFTGLDGQALKIDQPQLGALSLPLSGLWKLYPNSHFPVFDGGRDSDALAGAPSAARLPGKFNPLHAGAESPWIYLDGAFIPRPGSNPPGQQGPMLAPPFHGALDCFEINLDLTQIEGPPSLYVSLRAARSTTQVNFWYYAMTQLQLMVMNRRGQGGPNMRTIDLTDKFAEASTRVNLRIFVNAKLGTVDLFLDGVAVAQVGHLPSERCPGIGDEIELGPYATGGSPTILSNLWIGPWSGELPSPGDQPQVCLVNGDVTRGTAAEVHDGRLRLESEVGEIEMPLEKIEAIDFGGAFAPQPAVGRVYFQDGSALNVESFRWDASGLAARSATLGDLRLPAAAVRELILSPALPRAPHPLAPEKPAKKREDTDSPPPAQK